MSNPSAFAAATAGSSTTSRARVTSCSRRAWRSSSSCGVWNEYGDHSMTKTSLSSHSPISFASFLAYSSARSRWRGAVIAHYEASHVSVSPDCYDGTVTRMLRCGQIYSEGGM